MIEKALIMIEKHKYITVLDYHF